MPNNKYIHTYKYIKLSNGNKPYTPIRIAIWKWGFGVGYESKTKMMGFALNSRKYPQPKYTQTDSYTHKYR